MRKECYPFSRRKIAESLGKMGRAGGPGSCITIKGLLRGSRVLSAIPQEVLQRGMAGIRSERSRLLAGGPASSRKETVVEGRTQTWMSAM